MATLPVFDRAGNEIGKYEIDPTVLAPRINRQLLHDAVVMYQANLRQGTHKTKTRAEVAGTTKKMYRQKGTGNARAGSRRSGVRRGGGHIFALRPRDYSYRLPRKALQLATRMALAAKIRDSEVVLIDELKFATPKTRDMAAILTALKLGGQSVLVATAGHDVNVFKSARNIDRVAVSPTSDLNALSLLKTRHVLMTRDALDTFRKLAEKAGQGEGATAASGQAKAARSKPSRAKSPRAAAT
ncbi:MAG: 50S ribosomal protein L4 [Pirellulales bacterium]|nr:50S ribosomal protein L4 [Pirellulales bacterium]